MIAQQATNTQHFITSDIDQVTRFLTNVKASCVDSFVRGRVLGITLTATGVIVTRQGHDGRSIQSYTFKAVQ